MQKTLVLYHANCWDGFMAAWVLWMAHNQGETAEFLPVQYGDAVPDLTGRDVWIVDFSFDPEVLIPACEGANSVVMVDHHRTAIAKWEAHIATGAVAPENLLVEMDPNYSGAWLTFVHMNKHRLEAPVILKYSQDYDLWKKQYPQSSYLHTYIQSQGIIERQDFYAMERLAEALEDFDQLTQYSEKGRAIEDANAQLIKKILKRTGRLVMFAKHITVLANVPHDLVNQAADMIFADQSLVKGATGATLHFVAFYENLSDQSTKYSLRGKKDSPVDLAYLCRLHGGGGHHNAASFTRVYLNKREFIHRAF